MQTALPHQPTQPSRFCPRQALKALPHHWAVRDGLAHKVAGPLLYIGASVLLVTGCSGGPSKAERMAATYQRANTVCGHPPARVETRDSWQNGFWLVVHCRDGRVFEERP